MRTQFMLPVLFLLLASSVSAQLALSVQPIYGNLTDLRLLGILQNTPGTTAAETNAFALVGKATLLKDGKNTLIAFEMDEAKQPAAVVSKMAGIKMIVAESDLKITSDVLTAMSKDKKAPAVIKKGKYNLERKEQNGQKLLYIVLGKPSTASKESHLPNSGGQ